MPYHPLTTQIMELLRSRGMWFETFEHAPVRTSAEAAEIRDGYSLHQGVKDVRFATVEEVLEVTGGVQPGGVPPFAQLFGLEVLVDPTLLANEKIIFNAGDRSFSIGMKSEDYAEVVQPRVMEIT